jgi:hypothetical protein
MDWKPVDIPLLLIDHDCYIIFGRETTMYCHHYVNSHDKDDALFRQKVKSVVRIEMS